LKVRRVSPKAAKDYAEIFDGVPSQHDGKDAAVVAELSALGRSWPWDFVAANVRDQEIKYRVDAVDWERRQMMREVGRLEGLLSRHWPEATRLLKVNSGTLLRALVRYGSPAKLAADPEAFERLRGWGRHLLSAETVRALAASARETSGVRVDDWSERSLTEAATAILECKRRIAAHTRGLTTASRGNATIERQSTVVGTATACVLWRHLGDPAKYPCGAAYRKAMGLNLKERSSGRWQGQLKGRDS
jgi:transposase